MASKVQIRRCAVYTRKSSEEGLQQEFNSLDAQREAGVAYVRSQVGEGWRLVDTQYDDGGISGGTLERPALRRLLDDIAAGKIHVVVVYKVDRLTRSLGDFAKLVEVFEGHGVSFVSVTQQFNTTTSMGRLMLNVLLSFAQFEREVTGERIRDKITASKRKGMWMGGVPPIGYEVRARKLLVVEEDAKLVRHIYRRYVEVRSITLLAHELVRDGHRTRVYASDTSRGFGGKNFSGGHLHRILRNRMYIGEVVHQGIAYPGEHDAIIDANLWASVEAILEASRNGHRGPNAVERAPLTGKVFDDAGNRMSPTQARKGARRYRYYVSRAILDRRPDRVGVIPRVPAQSLEDAVFVAVRDQINAARLDVKVALRTVDVEDREALLARAVDRVVVRRDCLHVTLSSDGPSESSTSDDETQDALEPEEAEHTIEIPFSLQRRAGSFQILPSSTGGRVVSMRDPSLIKAVVRGKQWAERLLSGEGNSPGDLAREAGVTTHYLMRLVRYAFLAPDITEAILAGTQSARITVESLREPIPLDWSEQRRLFGLTDR